MSIMEKRVFYNINDVTSYLESIGFTISGNKILWNYAESDTACYWKLNNDIITFQRSDGQNAFQNNLVDFNMTDRPKCVIITITLQDNGIALYMGMVAESVQLSSVFPCCANRDSTLNNGLVVLSPQENDGHWYYGWNDCYITETIGEDEDSHFEWCLDNGHGNYEYGENVSQLGQCIMYNLSNNISISKIYFNSGYWSKNIFAQLVGPKAPPGSIFKLQGQKYITFCCSNMIANNSINWRIPVYRLEPDVIEMNDSTSTNPYSTTKTYVSGDYCTFNGYLYKCITGVPAPEPFDDAKWTRTTVYTELLDRGNHIYGA